MSEQRDIWDFWASRYEGLWAQRYSLGPSRRSIHEHLEVVAPDAERILDVGCGVGQLAQELAQRRPGCEIVGCDASPAMITQARSDHGAPNLSYHRGPVEGMERGTGFDAIVCTHAFPYFPDKPASMAAMAALLRPGGRLLIIQANTENLYDRSWLLIVRLTATPSRYHSAAGLHELMQGAGLQPGVVRSVDKPRWIPSIQLVEGIK
jgi:2-polyprenyl-3-methyl-5-hydroxy-6-metoxy-1,4-benzoquinol methylase